MSAPNPFAMPSPLIPPMSFGTGTYNDSTFASSQRHGSAEQGGGGQWSSITPPRTPRSSSGRRTSRSRERRSPRGDQSGDDSERIQQGWGPRIVLLERKFTNWRTPYPKRMSPSQSDLQMGLRASMRPVHALIHLSELCRKGSMRWSASRHHSLQR